MWSKYKVYRSFPARETHEIIDINTGSNSNKPIVSIRNQNVRLHICSKSYTLKRNLNRHIKEKHRGLEYWLCEMRGCRGSFIRREYLKRHLIFCHKLESVTAGRLALRAPRGDDHPQGYYEDVSEDDSVLDVLPELMDPNQMEFDAVIDAFDVNAFGVITGNTLRSGDVNSDFLGGCVSGSDVQDANVRACEIRNGDVINDNILGGNVIKSRSSW